MTSTNYPIDLKLPKWWDVMGLKIDKIMGYNGLATKKTHHSQAFGSLLSVNAQRVFDSFLGGKTTNIRLKNCLIVSSFQLYKSVKLFMKSILNNKFFGSLLSVIAQRFWLFFGRERPQTSDWNIVWSFPLFNLTKVSNYLWSRL